MNTALAQLASWMAQPETEHIEFKEAKRQFDGRQLLKYCIALANEGGGRLILGVDDRRPRQVVGTRAFRDLGKTKIWVLDMLHTRVDTEELSHPDGRVVVFTVPSRPVGLPLQLDGVYLMRVGESLRPMSPERLREILAEADPDFSAQICRNASSSDLDGNAIATLRRLWATKSGNPSLTSLSDARILEDVELLVDGEVTYAALILLGTRQALARHLAQAEVVFEYRSSDASGPAQQRIEYREGFFVFFDRLWDAINLRNEAQHFQQGLAAYRERHWNEAMRSFRQGLERVPGDAPSQLFIARCNHFLEFPPPDDWNGVYRLTSK